MEEKIKEYIRAELWELVDAVVEYKYYGGKEIRPEIIAEKERKLSDIVGPEEGILDDCPCYSQAKFILSNAKRCIIKAS